MVFTPQLSLSLSLSPSLSTSPPLPSHLSPCLPPSLLPHLSPPTSPLASLQLSLISPSPSLLSLYHSITLEIRLPKPPLQPPTTHTCPPPHWPSLISCKLPLLSLPFSPPLSLFLLTSSRASLLLSHLSHCLPPSLSLLSPYPSLPLPHSITPQVTSQVLDQRPCRRWTPRISLFALAHMCGGAGADADAFSRSVIRSDLPPPLFPCAAVSRLERIHLTAGLCHRGR